MTYDEFAEKLRKIKAEYQQAHGRPLETVAELEALLDRRLAKPRNKGLRSLKGIIP